MAAAAGGLAPSPPHTPQARHGVTPSAPRGSPYFYAPFRATAGEGSQVTVPQSQDVSAFGRRGAWQAADAAVLCPLLASGPHGRASRRCGGRPRLRHSAEGSEPRFQFVPAGPSCWEPRADPLSGRGRRAGGGGRPAPGRRQVTESGAPAPRRQSCEPELGGSLAGRLGAAAPPGGR